MKWRNPVTITTTAIARTTIFTITTTTTAQTTNTTAAKTTNSKVKSLRKELLGSLSSIQFIDKPPSAVQVQNLNCLITTWPSMHTPMHRRNKINWRLTSADLPTPPEPRITSLYSRIVELRRCKNWFFLKWWLLDGIQSVFRRSFGVFIKLSRVPEITSLSYEFHVHCVKRGLGRRVWLCSGSEELRGR